MQALKNLPFMEEAMKGKSSLHSPSEVIAGFKSLQTSLIAPSTKKQLAHLPSVEKSHGNMMSTIAIFRVFKAYLFGEASSHRVDI